ncbi:putative CTD small phosphatase-like protein 2-like isoform X2 [Capsicum annuum]|nr:putative CTD small phosphatase-like protein 2-like isoform X2 [Capsicum annuum]
MCRHGQSYCGMSKLFCALVVSCIGTYPLLCPFLDSLVVTSKSSSKIIFSPTLEPVGAHNNSDISSDGDTAVASYSQECRTSGETVVQLDDSNLYMEIHHHISFEQSDAFTYIESNDQAECFDLYSFIRNLSNMLERPNILPKESQRYKSITLVLDLDETLVHSKLEHCDESDFIILNFFSMKEHVVYVNQRFHLRTFLERFVEMFKVVIFTASQSIYAKQLLDILDPDGNIISRFLKIEVTSEDASSENAKAHYYFAKNIM